MTMTSAQDVSPLLERVRGLGKCAPSLLKWDAVNSFDEKVLGILEMEGISLPSDAQAAEGFESIMKMAASTDSIPGALDTQLKTAILVQRRAILLAILGSTASNNIALKTILSNGVLIVVKTWLDDILNKSVGGVDLLLHLLTNITHLPVTKDMVANSKLGKAVVAIGNHKICTGGGNENAIKERIAAFKDEWSASVKHQLKIGKEDEQSKNSTSKRSLEASTELSENGGKKARVEPRNHMNTSSLLSNVQPVTETKPDLPPLAHAPAPTNNASATNDSGSSNNNAETTKRITWADDKLFVYDDRETRKKSALVIPKNSKSKVDLKQAKLDAMGTTNPPLVPWKKPQPLKNVNVIQVTSHELAKQVSRMASVVPTEYASEEDVPNSPSPLNDIEQALDMTSQASSNPETIPFFAPQPEKEAPAPAPVMPVQQQPPLAPANIAPVVPQTLVPPPPPPRAVNPGMQGATIELVQALGLPVFLVGQSIQALQTLAATPNLLNTFVDANGMYDQVRLLNLVQTLTQNLAPAQPAAQTPQVNIPSQNPYATQQYGQQNSLLNTGYSAGGGYQAAMAPAPPAFQQTQTSTYAPQSNIYGNNQNRTQGRKINSAGAGYRGDQNGSDTNLHISGYGPTTTQADIMALFAPYVHVSEVVTKNGFSFVNTRDPSGARRAREALNGAILGGRPIRINIATRRAPDPSHDSYGRKSYQQQQVPTPLPRNALGQVDYDQVRDDRGNPATKNLFVAGYGPGTTEQDLRILFSQHAQVSGTVMKGSFAFINTTDKVTAIQAREALIGTPLNGGVLRINFAKESGRLGTSFDQTYGPASRSPYMRDR